MCAARAETQRRDTRKIMTTAAPVNQEYLQPDVHCNCGGHPRVPKPRRRIDARAIAETTVDSIKALREHQRRHCHCSGYSIISTQGNRALKRGEHGNNEQNGHLRIHMRSFKKSEATLRISLLQRSRSLAPRVPAVAPHTFHNTNWMYAATTYVDGAPRDKSVEQRFFCVPRRTRHDAWLRRL